MDLGVGGVVDCDWLLGAGRNSPVICGLANRFALGFPAGFLRRVRGFALNFSVVPFAQAENRGLRAHRTWGKRRSQEWLHNSLLSVPGGRVWPGSEPRRKSIETGGPPVDPARARCLSSL